MRNKKTREGEGADYKKTLFVDAVQTAFYKFLSHKQRVAH